LGLAAEDRDPRLDGKEEKTQVTDDVSTSAPQPWPEALACLERLLGRAARTLSGDRAEDDAADEGDPVGAIAAALREDARAAWLADSFGLDDLDLAILAVAMAPEIDLRFERLYGFLQDGGGRREASVDLCLRLLLRTQAQRLAAAARFTADGTLLGARLLDAAGAGGPSTARSVRPDPQLAAFLLGRDTLDARLALSCRVRSQAQAVADVPLPSDARARLAEALGRGCGCVFLRTEDAEQARALAAAMATAPDAGGRVLDCDLRVLAEGAHGPGSLELVFREAWLRSLVVHLRGAEALPADAGGPWRDALAGELARTVQPTLLSADIDWAALELDVPGVVALDGRALDAHERAGHWRRCARRAGLELDEDTLTQAAQRFRLRPAQIARAAALAAGGGREAVFAAAREQSGRRLGELAVRIRPRRGWRDVVLPPDSLAQLHEICMRVAQRERVLGDWGFGRRLSQGLGTTALFAGPSGTGKTMTAEIIAGELGLDLYRIDLATIVSKYIGETEKNLDRVFLAAEDANAVLLFDEAEALFGKRSEVRDAHDRYANVEIAYLLQRMEAFPGLAILSTNMRQNLDEAFSRRLAFVVSFPFPEAAQRRHIWAGMWPRETPLSEDVDLDLLAARFALSGGNIRNVVLAAAFLAAGDGGTVCMRHLLHGARREFQKLGRTLSEADLQSLATEDAA
jgi:hypothetical protein